jgi:hypothetical protein
MLYMTRRTREIFIYSMNFNRNIILFEETPEGEKLAKMPVEE